MIVARLRLSMALVVLSGVMFLGAVADAVVMESPEYVLTIDEEQGHVVSFFDKAAKFEHLLGEKPGPLWLLELSGSVGGLISGDDARTFTWMSEDGETPSLRLVWSDFARGDAPDLVVRVDIDHETSSGMSRWRLQMSGLAALSPAALHFPRIADIAPRSLETVAAPYWMGEKTTTARAFLSGPDGTGRRREWTYPGLMSLQCITLYQEDGPGLYLAANDCGARSKSFAVFGDGRGGLGVEARHFPGADAVVEGAYSLGYEMLLGAFQGDWTTAAAQYRRWATAQSWVRESRLKRGLLQPWAADTGLWIWNRGHSPGVLKPAELAQDYFEAPISVFWHWWHGCAYDAGFPEYLPPREGTQAFRDALSQAQAAGIHAIVYMNQRLWGMTTDSWTAQQAERYAVKGPDGTVRPEVYNTFTKSPCASMCMGTSFWRDVYAGIASEAFSSLGVNGIYMDQACSSLVCYDAAHGHAPGGGAYWMEGFRSLESDLRTRCPGIVLAGEGCGEAWLPHLDLMLSLQVSLERYAAPGEWEPIPFFHAVYHDCAAIYGNYASLTRPPYDSLWPPEFAPARPLELLDVKFRHQFRLEQARAFVWGQQPCLANFTEELLTERREDLAYLKRLVHLRAAALPWLLHGTFVPPPRIEIPDMEIDMSRLSIYAGQQDAVQEYRKRVPQWLLGVWRSEKGDLALAAANISDAPQKMLFHLTAEEHGLPESGKISQIRIREDYEEDAADNTLPYCYRAELGAFSDGSASISHILGPAEACIFVFEK